MEIAKITTSNILFHKDQQSIKKGLIRLKGVVKVNIKPQKNKIVVSYENINRENIINRLYALGYFEELAKNSQLLEINNSIILLPQ